MKIHRNTTFAWPHREGGSWTLLVLIFAMLLLHSSAFFLFQTVTPNVKPPPRIAPPVQLITAFGPDGLPSAENLALLRWIDSVDPAVEARMPEVLPPNLLEIPYRSSFSTMRTAPLSLPPEPETVQFPPARNPLALILGSAKTEPPPAPASVLFPTKVSLPASLQARAPEIKFTPQGRTAKPLDPTLVLLGVTDTGEVRFAFPQRPEQREPHPLDAEALDFLGTLKFTPATGQPILWGMATIEWGDDVTAPE